MCGREHIAGNAGTYYPEESKFRPRAGWKQSPVGAAEAAMIRWSRGAASAERRDARIRAGRAAPGGWI